VQDRANQPHLDQRLYRPPLWFLVGLDCLTLDFREFVNRRSHCVTTFVTRLGGKGKERTGKDRTNGTLQANEIATNLGKPLQ
jgi:hypothetical protein